MGKLHIGEISELSHRVCNLESDVEEVKHIQSETSETLKEQDETLNGVKDDIESIQDTQEDHGDRIEALEGEQFVLISEDDFDALSPEQKAEKNYAVIEE